MQSIKAKVELGGLEEEIKGRDIVRGLSKGVRRQRRVRREGWPGVIGRELQRESYRGGSCWERAVARSPQEGTHLQLVLLVQRPRRALARLACLPAELRLRLLAMMRRSVP